MILFDVRRAEIRHQKRGHIITSICWAVMKPMNNSFIVRIILLYTSLCSVYVPLHKLFYNPNSLRQINNSIEVLAEKNYEKKLSKVGILTKPSPTEVQNNWIQPYSTMVGLTYRLTQSISISAGLYAALLSSNPTQPWLA